MPKRTIATDLQSQYQEPTPAPITVRVDAWQLFWVIVAGNLAAAFIVGAVGVVVVSDASAGLVAVTFVLLVWVVVALAVIARAVSRRL